MSLRGTTSVEARLDASSPARDLTPYVRRLMWSESLLQGGFDWSMELTTNFWDEWNDILLGITAPQLRLVFQWADGSEETTDWKTAVVDRTKLTYKSTAMTFLVQGADRRLDLMQTDRTRSWPGTTVAEVIRRIGDENGLETIVSDTAYRTDRWQLRQHDWGFINSLAGSSSSVSGRGDIYLWVDEGKLYYQAPQMQRRSVRRHVMQEIENRVERIVVTYNGREVDRRGGATLRGVGFDLDTKAPTVFTMDAGQAQTQPALARRVPRDPADGLRVLPTDATGVQLGVEELVRARWGAVSPRYFALRMDTRPDLTLKPSTIVELQGDLDSDRSTAFLGRFAVLEVRHTYASGAGASTTVVGYRREAYAGAAEPTGAAVAQVGTSDNYRGDRKQDQRVVIVAEDLS